jgi:trehalose-phosphatase
VATPSESQLPPELAELLSELAALPGLLLAIVSGRPREDLERLLAPVPGAWLVAEHGGWRRRGGAWEAAVDLQPENIEPLAARLQQLTATVPGVLVERKTWSVTFHYRLVPARERAALLVAVDAALEEWLAQTQGFERLDGVEMLEVRPSRMHKGLAVPWLREQLGAGARLLAFGDDLTDEDLFRELGVVDEPVLVGPPRRSRGRWRLADPAAVAALLGWIAVTRRGEAAAHPCASHNHSPRRRRRPRPVRAARRVEPAAGPAACDAAARGRSRA